MQAAGLDFYLLICEPDRNYVVGDVRRILRVMRNRRLRQFGDGSAMRVCDRPERRIAHWRSIKLKPDIRAQLADVVESEAYDEIVGVCPSTIGLPYAVSPVWNSSG